MSHPAALNPILGREKTVRSLVALAEKSALLSSMNVRPARINNLPGFVATDAEGRRTTVALDVADGLVTGLYIVTNPDKLRHVAM